MMSIFSPFDVFCAESNGRKLFNFSYWPSSSSSMSSVPQFDRKTSPASSSSAIVDRDHDDRTIPVNKDTQNSNKIVDRSGKQPMRVTKKKIPRFAVELDGVHCFETIVPY